MVLHEKLPLIAKSDLPLKTFGFATSMDNPPTVWCQGVDVGVAYATVIVDASTSISARPI